MTFPTDSQGMLEFVQDRQQSIELDSYARIERKRIYEPIQYLLEVADQLGSGGLYNPPDPVRERAALEAVQFLVSEHLKEISERASGKDGQESQVGSPEVLLQDPLLCTADSSILEVAPESDPPSGSNQSRQREISPGVSQLGSVDQTLDSSSPSSSFGFRDESGFDEGGNMPAGEA